MGTQSLVKLNQVAHLEHVVPGGRGESFELSGDRLTLGRHENNDIVLAAEGISRYHAVMERTSEGRWTISDNQSKNGIGVNGKQVPSALLNDGDVIQVGTYNFRFREAGHEAQAISPAAEAHLEGISPYDSVMGTSSGRSAGPKSKRPLIYGGGALVLAGLWYMLQEPPKPSPTEGTTAPSDKPLVAPQLPVTSGTSKVSALDDPLLTRAEQQLDKMDLGNNSLKEAEEFFKKGQREYLHRNFHRAIDDFRTALNLNRSHELADYYMRLSIFEVEAEAKQNMEIGRKYFESLQYSRATYHFNQVIALMVHRNTDKMVTDAQKYLIQCQRRLQAAEQMP